MLQPNLKPAYILSVIIAILAAVTAAGGLFLADLYRDNTWTTSQLRGNDLVTLVVAVPALVVALIQAAKGVVRWQLVWLAMLGYMLYNYIFYLYGAAYNSFFLLYVVLLTLSIFALVIALSKVEIEALRRSFGNATPVKAISGYMLFIALVLGGMWLSQYFGYLIGGQVPPVIAKAGASTSVVFATDLALLVPCMGLGAVWLWQRQGWGYLLAAIMMIKGATYTLALLAMGLFAALNGTLGEDWILLPLWGALCAGCLVVTVLLLANVQNQGELPEAVLKKHAKSKLAL